MQNRERRGAVVRTAGERPLVVLLFALTSCATIISGTTQKVSITSAPSGASVTVEPGGKRATTPAEFVLERKVGAYTIKFEKAGYEPVTQLLKSTDNGWLWANILLGGLVGIVVDYSTGAAYTFDPAEVHAILPEASADSSGTQGDTTVFVFEPDHTLLAKITLSSH